MRLTSIDLYSNNNQIAALNFKDPRSKSPYVAQQVTGLDADEIVPKFYGTNLDGTVNHHNLVVNKREIVILISLNPSFSQGKTYSDLRDDLYRGIASSRDGTIQIHLKNSATTVATISGFVTKFETGLFSKTPQAQLTIRCDDGMLRSPYETTIDTALLGVDNTIVDEVSTSPHGFKFDITFDAVSDNIVIQDGLDPTWTFSVTPGDLGFGTGFFVDDILHFSSAYDGHTVYIKRGLATIYLLDKVDLGSTWPIMFPGANEFTIVTDGAFSWNNFSYFHTYWGV